MVLLEERENCRLETQDMLLGIPIRISKVVIIKSRLDVADLRLTP